MAQEQKAKAYDGNYKAYTDLINRLEDVKNAITKQNYGIAMDMLCKPYPEFQITTHSELKESEDSEDESIRKKLLLSFKCVMADADEDELWYGLSYNDIIVWLEKQGKNNMGISEATKRELEDNLNKALEKETPESCNEFLEQQGEQKPVDKVEPKFHVGDIVKRKDNPHLTYILKRFTDDGDYEFHAIGKNGHEGCTCFAIVKYQDEWELIEQKPAWSEEDENINQSIIDILTKQGFQTQVDWLRTLKDKVQPQSQPKQEWSEEDEDIINHLLAICAGAKRYRQFAGCSQDDVVKYQTWLKSLRPQSQWKPSEEQMDMLKIAVSTSNSIVLDSLYYDLKKLKG